MVLNISFMRGLWVRGIFACAGLGEVAIVLSLLRDWFAPADAAEYFRATKSLLPCLLALALALLMAQIIGIAVRDMSKKPSMDSKDVFALILFG